MANQIIIDIGAVANDGTGDPLRTAFNDVNLNFANVWATGVANSNIAFNGNKILTVNTNGNLVLAPNGIGVVQSNVSILPNISRAHNLGSASKLWDSVYTYYLEVSELSIPGDLTVGGNLTVSGNIIEMGNIVTDALTIQLANTASTANAANGSGVTVGANDNIATMLYSSTSNTWVMNIGLSTGNLILSGDTVFDLYGPRVTNGDLTHGSTSGLSVVPNGSANATVVYNTYGNVQIFASNTGANVNTYTFGYDGNLHLPGVVATGNITGNYFIGNGSQLTGITSYANANAVAYGESGWAGNIIPATSNVYSLGNSTNQWSDLYVSNATIYMNNVPISLTAGNVLTVNGDDVVTTNANGTVNLGNLTVNDYNIYNAAGQGVIISNFSFVDEAETAYVQIPAGNSTADLNVVQEQGNVRLVANSAVWNFGTDGNLIIPNGGYINFVNNGGITQALNKDLRFTVSDDEQDGWAIQSTVNDGAGNDLTRMQVRYDGIQINTDVPTNNYNWTFRDSGEFDVPKSIRGPVGGNLIIECGDQFGSTTFIDLQTRSYVGDALISNIRIGDPNVTVSTASGAYNWTFGGTGNLTLPLSGNLVGATANHNGYLSWFGNSSGDGNGYTTMRLVPDDTLEGNDQYLIIDPTAPGHIHIRAGGTQDNSGSDLFLGGENSYFKVNAGANNEVRISANSHAWVFGADSILTVPGEGIIRSIQDTVILQSYDVNGNTYSARLGTTGGLYFETSAYPLGWLNLTNSSGDANISSPGGSINIDSANGTSGAAGKDINITAGDADQTDYYTTAGGDINIQGGMGAFNDGGGGGPGGNVNLVAGTSADPAGHAGNVTITSGSWNWQFINNGNLYVPGQINGDNNGALIIDGAGYGNGYISLPAGSFGGEQVAIVNDFSLGNGIALTTNGGTWHFGNSGAFTAPGNITTTANISGGYILGNAAFMTGIPASYGNANVADFLDSLGSNAIVTTGNISGGNLIVTNATMTGNLVVNTSIASQGATDLWLLPATGTTRSYGNINPFFANTYNLGGSTTRWNNVFANVANVITLNSVGNITGGNLITGGQVSATGSLSGQTLVLTASAANEGGEIQLALPSSGTTLTGNIIIDSYQNSIRLFEGGGNTRGLYVDVPNVSASGQYAIGYRDVPQIALSANVTADGLSAGKHFYSTTAGNLQITIPDNANVAYPTGATITIVVNAAGNVIVAQGTGVSLYMAGSSSTGNRTVGAYGLASVMKVATDTWVISGTGVY